MFITNIYSWRRDLISTVSCVNFIEDKWFEGNMNLNVSTIVVTKMNIAAKYLPQNS